MAGENSFQLFTPIQYMSFPACSHGAKIAQTPPPRRPRPPFIAFICNEPFRVFFPLGIIAAVLGVLLWPAFYAGWIGFYPVFAHPRMMIEGFLACFVIGFLGTAGPRILSAPRLKPPELILMFTGMVACMVFQSRGDWQTGDSIFLGVMVLLLCGLLTRALFLRKDLPPPPLLLAVLGLLSAIVGIVLIKLSAKIDAGAGTMRFANLLLYQGFLLLPVMGIGTFFFPRLLGVDAKKAPPGKRRWIFTGAFGLAILSTFAVESWVSAQTGLSLRAVLCCAFLLREVHWLKKAERIPGSLSMAMKTALYCGAYGLLAAAVIPQKHVAFEHLLYIGGFALLTLVVASRVLLGHSGDIAIAGKKLWVVRIIAALTVLAALTRISADIFPKVQISHYKYAAWLSAFVFLAWAGWHLRRFFKPDPED